MKMLILFFYSSFIALIKTGSCMPTRMTLDGNWRDESTPVLSSWDLWDTYGGEFLSYIPQFDTYIRPTIGQLRNFGYPLDKLTEDQFLSWNHQQRKPHTWLRDCEDQNQQNVLVLGGNLMRCRRRSRDWIQQEPLYADEPQWVPLEAKIRIEENTKIDDDPFIVARGRRSSSSENQNFSGKKFNGMKDESQGKRKPDTEGSSDSYVYLNSMKNYLQPRDKHSDIMDILSEPFFVSRGKKNAVRKSDLDNDMSTVGSVPLNLDDNPRPIRGRRGKIVEELLNQEDPFYIARGRRSRNYSMPSMFLNRKY